MNHIALIGRLTRDPELRYTPNGVAVANFDLAVDRSTTNQQGERETDFIRIVTWQKQAEVVANYLKKGRLVAVEGRLQIRNYETQDGQKRKAAEVVASRVQFLEKARDEVAPTGHGNSNNTAEANDDIEGINLDDLPF
ncbi:MAG TPA: single-stranded DNA-binding protein [Firmicutes bacterium]|jgi:single-strand DNA-binding protein|nr:single-stranded DNA-binding protein [Bacillota bacterium]